MQVWKFMPIFAVLIITIKTIKIMTIKEIIKGFTNLLTELKGIKEKSVSDIEVEVLNNWLKEMTHLRLCFKKGLIKDLNDFQKYAKWNYPAYFIMSYDICVNGLSLRDLREMHGNSLDDVVRVMNAAEFI